MQSHFIVTPVRNAVRTIDATIWSIVSQVGDIRIHYHVQDGQSNDGTLEKLEVWARRLEGIEGNLPARVIFTFGSEPDNGMYDAICKGFARMDIPADAFMSWCNADDALWPGALDAVVRLGNDLPTVDWIMGWQAWFDDNNRFTAIDRNPHFPYAVVAAGLADGIHWQFIQQESTFWRKRLWDKVGGVNPSLRLAGDWDLWYRFASHASLVHAQRQLGAFFVRPGQQSSNLQAYWAEVNRLVPMAVRQNNLRKSSQDELGLVTIPIATPAPNKSWQLGVRTCKWRARMFAHFLRRSPVVLPLMTRLFCKLWRLECYAE
jgi:glycosyltransferase involved in cell wall biosynthesis